MNKKLNDYLNPLAILAVATITCVTPSYANEINVSSETIEIYVPPPESRQNRVCREFLDPIIGSIIGKYPNNWGILVESLEDKTVLYSHNADKYFIPASNIKLFTTAAALQKLNPQTSIRSKSLRDWVTTTNLRSDNSYAEILMKYIGGPGAVKAILTGMGVNPNRYRLADGSGLSRRNIATPRAIIEVLRIMYYSPNRDVFSASLPVAGVSGTLKNRLRQTSAQGIVRAKTGTLWGVRALSGYINHPEYGVLVFSILANNSKQSGQVLVKEIDRIVLQLSVVTTCQ